MFLFRRLFVSFPGGVSGVALLLLRVVAGGVLSHYGFGYWRAGNASAALWPVAALLAAGALLAVGFLTPIVAAAALAHTALSTGLVHPDGVLDTLMLDAILVAVLLQGPGAFSLDARIFGRREILIPLPWE